MTFDQPTVTLVAAAVAAVASLSNAGVSIFFARKATTEAQYRELMKPFVVALGEDLHQVVACSAILAARAQDEHDTKAWFKKAHDACSRLKDHHRKVKYPLGEVAEGIRELSRLANWVDHVKSDGPRATNMVAAGDRLRGSLDAAIRTAFLRGQPPSWFMRRRVAKAAAALRASWDLGKPSKLRSAASDYDCEP